MPRRSKDGKQKWDGGVKVRVTSRGARRYDAQVYLGRHPTTDKPTFVSKTFDRKADAKRWVLEQQSMKAAGLRTAPSKQTLAEYLRDWLEVYATQARAVTVYNYRATLTKWVLDPAPGVPVIGAIRLDRLTKTAFEKLYTYMNRQAGMGPRGCQYLHGTLRQALNDAVHDNLIPRNPTDRAKRPKRYADGRRESVVVKAMDEKQAKAFLAAAKQEPRCFPALFHMLLQGGLRPCEAFALHWRHVDFDAGTVTIEHTLTRVGLDKKQEPWRLTETKTERVRIVPLPGGTMQLLQVWRTEQKRGRLAVGSEWQEHNFVFTTQLGTPLDLSNVCRGAYRNVMERASIGEYGPEPKKPRSGPTARRRFTPAFRLYALRHTCATLLLKAGVNPKIVSERLGHASIKLTLDTYSHVLPDMQQTAVVALEKMFATA